MTALSPNAEPRTHTELTSMFGLPNNRPIQVWFRRSAILLAALLFLQFAWLLLSEPYRPGIEHLPTDATSAASAARNRASAFWAALIGGIRGDLWAQSAYTYADLLFGKTVDRADAGTASELAVASASVGHALDAAPLQSGVWLLCAGLALRYPSLGFNAAEALQMSFYTGPSEQELLPLRLLIAMQSETFDGVEMRPLISRDLRLLLAQKQNSAIATAYDIASVAGKRFLLQTVAAIDLAAAEKLRSAPHKERLPD